MRKHFLVYLIAITAGVLLSATSVSAVTFGSLTVDQTTLLADGAQIQTARLTATGADATAIDNAYIIINYAQAGEPNMQRGYFQWAPAVGFQSVGGGYYGQEKVNLLTAQSERVVAADGQSVTFIFRWTALPTYGTIADNDIAYYLYNSVAGQGTGWREIETNFAVTTVVNPVTLSTFNSLTVNQPSLVAGGTNFQTASLTINSNNPDAIDYAAIIINYPQSGEANQARGYLQWGSAIGFQSVGGGYFGAQHIELLPTSNRVVNSNQTVTFNFRWRVLGTYGNIPTNTIAYYFTESANNHYVGWRNSNATFSVAPVVIGGGTLRVVNAGQQPQSTIYVAGTNNIFSIFQLNANLVEDMYVDEILLRNDSNFDDGALNTVSLYTSPQANGTETLLGVVPFVNDGEHPGYAHVILSGVTRPRVPANGTLYLIVKANIVASSQTTAVSGLTPRIALASLKATGAASGQAIQPLFISSGSPTDSTADLPSNGTGGAGTVNDTGCDLNGAIVATATTLTIDNGGAGTCNSSLMVRNPGYTVPTGVVIKIANEEMLVTASTQTSLTVVRGVNGTTPTTHVDNANIYYGHPIADARNSVVVAYSFAGNSFTANNSNFTQGQVIRLDTEDMYVKAIAVTPNTVNAGLIYVDRNVNNTLLAAHNTASGGYNEYTAVQGEPMTIANTSPTYRAAVDSPSGAVLVASQALLLAKFNVSAANNTGDSNLNEVALNAIDVRLLKVGVNVTSMVLYPAENDNDPNFAVPGIFLSQNSVRFDMSILTNNKNRVNEGLSRNYLIRGNIPSVGFNSSIRLEITDVGGPGINGLGGTELGAGDRAPDVSWSEGVTNFFWSGQAARQVFLNFSSLTSSLPSGGAADTTSPVITSFVFGGAPDNVLGNGDLISITWSEPIDPTSINGGLVPGGLPVFVINNGTGDVSMDLAGIVSVRDIASTDVSVLNASTATNYSTTLSLNTASTTLTIALNGADASGAIGSSETLGDVAGLVTTVRDLNNNLQADNAVNASGNI